MKKQTDFSHIKGWGIDANPDNDPTFPMRTRYEDDNDGMNWQRPVRQTSTVEVLHSNERPDLTAVYGTTLPPVGISGAIRRFAFKYSESNWLHWLALILADRIDFLENDLSDIMRGHIPNYFAERGIKAELRYNTKSVLTKALIGGTLAYIGLRYCTKRR